MFGKEPLIPAYDLETLIDALPNFIANGSGTEKCLVIDAAADCAARLLIKLHEQGLIKFGE
ncbi:MAG: hypothetical protein FJ368_07040 [Pelagibacterales bacterium]|nr:hypothetical protein [Pelagibacterales bacterium]